MNGKFLHLPIQAHPSGRDRPASKSMLSRFQDLADEDFIERLKQGDDDALAALFRRYHRLVLSVALKILRDPGEAEDLLQEVFLEIYRKAGQFDRTIGSAKTWILQCAYYKSLSRRRYLAVRNGNNREHIFELSQLAALEAYYSPNGTGNMTHQEFTRAVGQGLATWTRSAQS